jgi:hypothetical protein
MIQLFFSCDMDLFDGFRCEQSYSSISHPPSLATSNGEIDDRNISERCDGMAVDGLVVNSSYFDGPSIEFEPSSCQDATNEAPTFGITASQRSEITNSERTLEKWEYLLRTRPRDPMYDVISSYEACDNGA